MFYFALALQHVRVAALILRRIRPNALTKCAGFTLGLCCVQFYTKGRFTMEGKRMKTRQAVFKVSNSLTMLGRARTAISTELANIAYGLTWNIETESAG